MRILLTIPNSKIKYILTLRCIRCSIDEAMSCRTLWWFDMMWHMTGIERYISIGCSFHWCFGGCSFAFLNCDGGCSFGRLRRHLRLYSFGRLRRQFLLCSFGCCLRRPLLLCSFGCRLRRPLLLCSFAPLKCIPLSPKKTTMLRPGQTGSGESLYYQSYFLLITDALDIVSM